MIAVLQDATVLLLSASSVWTGQPLFCPLSSRRRASRV